MKHNVIARRYLPTGIPVFPTLTLWLLLDRLQASGVVQAIVWTVWAIIALAMTTACFTEEQHHPKDFP